MISTINSQRSFIPDYTNAKSLLFGDGLATELTKSGTIEEDGYLQVHVQTLGTSGTPFWRLTINGCTVSETSKGSKETYMYKWSGLFPVRKGDSYNVAINGGTNCALTFYPCT